MGTESGGDHVVRYQATAKQLEFLRSSAREVLYSGAFRAGKTRALCMKLVARASVKGAHELLCRKWLSWLKATTLRTLLKPEGDPDNGGLPPVLPEGTYHHHKQERIIEIHGGGIIQYLGVADAEGTGSMGGTGVAIDEAVDLAKKDLTYLRGRTSVKVPGVPRQLYMACNPGPPTHPLAIRFGLRPGESPADGCEVIQTSSFDNPFLPEDYLDTLHSMVGIEYQRYVLGLWVGGEGAIYDRFLMAKHVKEIDTSEWPRTIIAVDDGYSNPFCALRIKVDGDGRMHVERCFYKPGLLMQSKVQAVLAMGGRDAEIALVDPAATGLIAELANAGVPVQGANNTVLDGILKVQERLHVLGDGRPRLTVAPECEPVLREFGSYSWKQARDGDYREEPVKKDDHAMDAIRYATLYLEESMGALLL